MSSVWKQVYLSEIADIIDSRHKTPVYTEVGFPMVRAVDIQGGRLNLENTKKVSLEVYNDFSKDRDPEIGDLIISRVGHYFGKISYVGNNTKFCLGQNIAFIIPKESSLYLYYFLTSPKGNRQIRDLGVGAAQPTISLKCIKSLLISLPPLKEQKAIAHILGSLDDKIELNRKMNETLEQMAQALFKSWFVDFDPVLDNALAAGNPIPEELQSKAQIRQALGDKRKPLPEHIQSLFPNNFTFNQTLNKWIPEGWDVKKLRDITEELRRGISPKYIEEGGIRVLNQKCIRNHEINFSLSRRNDPLRKKIDGRLLKTGDVLVNSTGTGTLGRIAHVVSLDEPTVADSHITVIRPNDSFLYKNFFSSLMFSLESLIEAMGEGSTGQTELSRARLSDLDILTPPLYVQNEIEIILGNYLEKRDKNKIESNSLIQLRDTLLPKLISGELRVGDLQKASVF